MSSVSVNPPKTPVTKGSNGTAAATIPNVCKMPGPPAPFVPAPLPNIGKSGKSPKDYTNDVTIEGNAVAIRGSTFESMGDIASKGTGGGMVSANCEGITKFVGPVSVDTKFEGGNVQLLTDPMLNNCAAGGSPPNSATMLGLLQATGVVYVVGDEPCPRCGRTHGEAAQLAENTATQHLAGEAQAAFRANGRGRIKTMVGAVICYQGELFYGANSGEQRHDAIWNRTPMHAPRGGSETEAGRKSRYRGAIGRPEAFERAWARAESKVAKFDGMVSKKKGADPEKKIQRSKKPAYPPGICAGPRAVLMALDHGGWPTGLTERFVDTKSAAATAQAQYRTTLDGPSQRGNFGGDQAVPPCESCQIILPMLICPDDRDAFCVHRNPPAGVCLKC